MIRGSTTYTVFIGSCRECGRPFESPTDDVRCDHPARTLRELKTVRPFEHVDLKRTKKPVTEYADGAVFDGHEWILPDGDLDVTVSPGMSDEGKAWIRAARRPSAYAKRCAVPDRTTDARRAFGALQANPATEAQVRSLKADAIALLGLNPNRAAAGQWWSTAVTLATVRTASWHAFNDQGKVVLSLRCDRDAALDCAMAYNAAGARLVLLSPEPILDDADVNDCVAIPDQRPPVEPVAVDPLITFAGDDGLLVRTAYGTVAFDRYSDGKAATNRVLVDPARTGTCDVTKLGGNRHDNDPLADNVEDWLRQLAEATPAVLHTGPASKLPRPGVVRFRKTPDAKLLIFTPAGFPPVMVDPAQVREVVAGSKLARVEVVTFGECPVVRVVRADGLIGYLSWFLNVWQYTTNEGRTVVVA